MTAVAGLRLLARPLVFAQAPRAKLESNFPTRIAACEQKGRYITKTLLTPSKQNLRIIGASYREFLHSILMHMILFAR